MSHAADSGRPAAAKPSTQPVPSTGMTHWHQLTATAYRSHASSRRQKWASRSESTGGVSSITPVNSRYTSACRPLPLSSMRPEPASGKAIQGTRLLRKAVGVAAK
jgi:hypothetical protein